MQVVQTIQPHMQTSMEAAFAPWAAIERIMRKAKEHNLPISINGLLKLDEIKSVVTGAQQVRDIISTFKNKGMVVKQELTADQRTASSMDRIGYMWAKDFKGEPYRPSVRGAAKKPSKPTTTKSPTEIVHSPVKAKQTPPKAVELCFQGVTLVVSRNPENGNTRIVIEG